MKKIVAIFLTICFVLGLTACAGFSKSATAAESGQSTTSNLTAIDYVNKLKDAGMPIDNIIVYTSDSDPNFLLGRPNQYISKVNFADTSLEQSNMLDPTGGSIEVFLNGADAQSRKDYLDKLGRTTPVFVEYSYINANALLRLNRLLTPEYAKKYCDEFMKIK